MRHATHRLLWAALVFTAACSGGTPTSPSPVGTTPTVPRLQFTDFLAFGDSLTEGKVSVALSGNIFTLAEADSYPFKLRSQLQARYTQQTIKIDNAGNGGEEAAVGGVGRFTDELIRVHPQVVFVMEGTNDLFQDPIGGQAKAITALESMLREAVSRGVKPFLATIPPQRRGGARERVARVIPDFNALVRSLAQRLNVPIVDVYAAIEPNPSLIGQDDLHMTELGYDVMTTAYFNAVKANLEVASTTR